MVRTTALHNYTDVHFTDEKIAHRIIEYFSPCGKCLEPFRGGDAFLRHLPDGTAWCELTRGVDFFDFTDAVDWIVTNPPFSNLTQVFAHSFAISENCVFLIPISKYWSSRPRLDLAKQYGGLVEILHVGTGRQIGFDIGFPFAALHFSRGYKGPINESFLRSAELAVA